MEQTAATSVMAAPRARDTHRSIPAYSLEARRRLATHLRETVCRMSNEEIQQRCGIPSTGAGPMRRDLAHIRSGKRERPEAVRIAGSVARG